jgi:hypothetical protein
VNDLHHGDAIFVGSQVTHPVFAENDISAGGTSFVSQRTARTRHDCVTSNPGFVNPSRYDYGLNTSSPCRRVGRRPGSADGFSLVPRFQYVAVAGHATRTDGGTIAGAFGG